MFVRAGVGWDPGIVGKLRMSLDDLSSESFAIREKCAVISQDINKEDRFEIPEFMKDAGVVALANVPILLPGGRAFGLLQVDAPEPRGFTSEDTEFLRTYSTILGPIIDRLLKLGELRASDERFRHIVEEARDYAIFITDQDGRITDWMPGAENVFGWRADEAVGQPGSILFNPEDREAGAPEKEIATARDEGVAPNVRWHLCKNGSRVFIEGSVRPLRDSSGALEGFLKIGQDVTERRAWQDRQQVLLGELQHRTRNLMGIVLKIADQTLRSSRDLEDFRQQFRDRISALARVQTLLSRQKEGERVTFDALVESELSAIGDHGRPADGQVTVDGPKGVALRSSTVQIFALALHELCTNALKYGALNQPEGRLSIQWRLGEECGQPWLYVDWRERGVAMPTPGTAPQGGGAGRELIEKALPYQLGAKTTYILEADGVHCTIALPVSEKNVRNRDHHG